ncbi:hypothetical protein N0V94_005158 [Neodidymelliopsis sp. IMI 364377]|nr:hypothetical protein N0V94_005158 [Neodidymelliopsis sp. IMI 364377]
MTTQSNEEVYDLLILVDATYSMVNYLEALQTSLPKIITISNLTKSFSRIGLLAYRDYCELDRSKHGLLEWSGWHNDPDDFGDAVEPSVTAQMLTSMAAGLEPIGGGDYPEATKTGLARAHQLMRKEATTLILLYTDAPPHCWMVADRDPDSNYYAEQRALCKPSSYDGFGHKFADWVSACRTLYEGEKKAHIFCFLDQELGSRPLNAGYYTFLSTITRGACFTLTNPTPHNIAHVTVDVLLTWMGAGKEGVGSGIMAAKLTRYKSGKTLKNIVTDRDELANTYFWAADENTRSGNVFISPKILEAQRKQEQIMRLDNNLAQIVVDAEALRKHLPKRRTPVMDFAKRYAEDAVYRNVVIEQLQNIVETDVTSMSLNPVFGVLWRKVCNDRQNPARNTLITAFGLHVEKILDADERGRMKNWLEESYDYATEILDMLDKVPEHQQFPCVFLDPTIGFAPDSAGKSGDQNDEHDAEYKKQANLSEELKINNGLLLEADRKLFTRLVAYQHMGANLSTTLAAERNASPAPALECTKCLNRVIWADEWRYMVTRPFKCTACIDEMKTVIEIDTTADLICKENGQAWLLRNDNRALEDPFKHSLFKTITTTGIDSFLRNVTVLPDLESAPILTLNGKRIQNLLEKQWSALLNWMPAEQQTHKER